jgi:copper resistance protein B
MKTLRHSFLALGVWLLLQSPASAAAQSATNTTHQAHQTGDMPGMSMKPNPATEALPPPHLQHGWPKPVADQMTFGYLLLDRLEYGFGGGADRFIWDLQGWYGGDYNRFWFKSEGEQATGQDKSGEGEVQALYSRLIAPFWDFQAGIRHDRTWGPGPDLNRSFAVIGLEGLAPYWFEVEPSLFISEDGDVSARFTASTDLLLTQRLILQPRIDLNAAGQSASRFGVEEGFNDVELGLRLRYEVHRQFAPYAGASWLRRLGETADLSRRNGGGVQDFRVVLGVRVWF